MKMNKLSMIGFGRLGQLLFRFLKEKIEIQIYDPQKENELKDSDFPFVNLNAICESQLIILAVPISQIKGISHTIRNYLNKSSVVMDVCAVKTYPLKIMQKYLSPEVQILGSHPLFGPQTVKDSLKDHIMIITPLQIEKKKLNQIIKFWSSFGIQVVKMTADEHDHLMAWSLAFTHFLGRALNGIPFPETTITTLDYRNVMMMIKKVNNNSWELFEDMHRYNPYTKEMREKVVNSIFELKNKIDQLKLSQYDLEYFTPSK